MSRKNPYQAPKSIDSQHGIGVYPFWKNALKLEFFPPLIFTIPLTVYIQFLMPESNNLWTTLGYIIGVWIVGFLIFQTMLFIPAFFIGMVIIKIEKTKQVSMSSWKVFLVVLFGHIIIALFLELLIKGVAYYFFNQSFPLFNHTRLQATYDIVMPFVYAICAVLVHKYLCTNPYVTY